SCTFTNSKGASLTVNKSAVGGDGIFAYTTSGSGLSGFSITTSGGSGSHGAVAFSTAQFGDKYATETPLPAGWAITNIACTAVGATVAIGTGQGGSFAQGASSGYDAGDDTVKVSVGAGNAPVCTFTNTRQQSTITFNE